MDIKYLAKQLSRWFPFRTEINHIPTAETVTLSDAQDLTNKRIFPRIFTTATTTTLIPELISYDYYEITAQNTDIKIGNPVDSLDSLVGGEKMLISITCSTVNKNITRDVTSLFAERGGLVFPTVLLANKKTELLFKYDAGLGKFNLIGLAQE